MEWLGVVGVALYEGLIVVPLILRIHRFLTALPCPACDEMGSIILHLDTDLYFAVFSNLWPRMQCVSCGRETLNGHHAGASRQKSIGKLGL